MTDLDLARARMTEIIQWWPILDDVADSLLGITGHGVSLTGPTCDSPESATELAVLQLDQIDQLSRDLTTVARKMGWRAGKDGNPRIYIHANLAWAATNLTPADYEPTITHTHKAIARLTGHAPRPTGRTCPACGENQLHIIDTGLHCDTCAITRHPDEVEALTNWRAANSEALVTQTEAANILGIPRKTIHTWIRRGHITTENGLVNIAKVKQHHERTRT